MTLEENLTNAHHILSRYFKSVSKFASEKSRNSCHVRASAVAFLASDEGAYINGHTLIVSGGSFMS